MKQAAWIPVAVGVAAIRVFAGPDIAFCVTAVTSGVTLDGTMAYSIGTNAVNIGADNLDVIQASDRHPMLGHNMYRLKDGRFEQIGQPFPSPRATRGPAAISPTSRLQVNELDLVDRALYFLDGAVGITDFLTLLANWGALHPCDFNGNGVDIVDVLQILANWGPCP